MTMSNTAERTTPSVWRLNIKPDASKDINPREFCINKNILGVGWRVDIEGEVDWESYRKQGEEKYYKKGDKGWLAAVNALKVRMKIDDLCWTRNEKGIYYLGRIVGEWKYCGDAAHLDADVVNIRECDWREIGVVDAVPGKVVDSFIPRRTVQQVDDDSVRLYSQYLYNLRSLQNHYPLEKISTDIFSMISSEDCEDIVGLYLQEQGYRIIPSSCKADTLAYEFVLKHAETGKTAVVQVKQGYEDLNSGNYPVSPEKELYLFTTHGKYSGVPSANIHYMDPNELKKFVYDNRRIMSDRINRWLDIIEQLEKVNI